MLLWSGLGSISRFMKNPLVQTQEVRRRRKHLCRSDSWCQRRSVGVVAV